MRLFICAVLLSACATAPGVERQPVKIYVHKNESKGFVRAQAQEAVPYTDAEGWIAMPAADFSSLLGSCHR